MINYLKENYWLTGILILATFLRLYHLDFQSAWIDEIITLRVSDPKLSFKEMHAIIMLREGFPHFYFLTIKYLSLVFEHGIYLSRFVSAISGILSILFIYLVGKELANKNAGLFAALILTVNALHIEHSQDGRSYPVLMMFVLIAVYRLLVLLKNFNYKNAILLGLFTGLITEEHPIGLLNVGIIFSALFVVMITKPTNKERFIVFKNSLVAGVVALLVFSPAYCIIAKVSDFKSFWVPAPTLENIKQVFIDLMGKTTPLFYGYIILILLFSISSVVNLIKKGKSPEKRKIQFAFFFLLLWVFLNAGVIIVKSYGLTSLILTRYFIGVLPAFVLMVSIAIAYIPYKYIRISLVTIISMYSLFFFFIEKKYYTTVVKGQYDKITTYIKNNNSNDDKVFSAHGWVMTYYINKETANDIVYETTFEDYVSSLKNNAVTRESFWYFDGNSRPFSLSAEDQQFLNKNYIIDHDVLLYDTWAKHYVDRNATKKKSGITIALNQFEPLNQDGQGNLMLFANGTSTSKKFYLKKGMYELTINGNSLPSVPLQGENAHIIVKINEQVIGNYYLSENITNKEKKITFNWDTNQKAQVSLVFDNDLAIDALDRNVVIYSLNLEKK